MNKRGLFFITIKYIQIYKVPFRTEHKQCILVMFEIFKIIEK